MGLTERAAFGLIHLASIISALLVETVQNEAAFTFNPTKIGQIFASSMLTRLYLLHTNAYRPPKHT